jgi:hypothetical protein
MVNASLFVTTLTAIFVILQVIAVVAMKDMQCLMVSASSSVMTSCARHAIPRAIALYAEKATVLLKACAG